MGSLVAKRTASSAALVAGARHTFPRQTYAFPSVRPSHNGPSIGRPWANTEWGLGPVWGIALAMAVAVVFALIMGFPTLRLKGPYFALAMLSGAVIMQRLMLIFWEYTGGEEGINGIEPLLRNPMHYYWLVLAALVLTTLLLGALARSNWGLILRAIRGDEATCQEIGRAHV